MPSYCTCIKHLFCSISHLFLHLKHSVSHLFSVSSFFSPSFLYLIICVHLLSYRFCLITLLVNLHILSQSQTTTRNLKSMIIDISYAVSWKMYIDQIAHLVFDGNLWDQILNLTYSFTRFSPSSILKNFSSLSCNKQQKRATKRG